ncbi:CHAT domain-containing protein [Oculatella sp. FACHB-28]|uniref:CHAT domain-containing protein n=1 Tax=Oculatella sp. FACHB-28 TaxID=2692845 RepID=UPI0016891D56|nr:CHAT domain-containing protein [Oculatella sp. FACHB-28]MBD2054763.1 CHAT domain-containing protein [Oculatella sp. FACHB-28]
MRRLLFVGLFCLSLVFSVLTSHLAAVAREPAVDVTAQVQQGVELYQQGDFQGAIAPWEAALDYYEQHPNLADEATVLENLARAHQSLGQATEAIALWQNVIDHYGELQPSPSAQRSEYVQQLGRSLTEQAQIYSRIGQSRKAVTLLCGSFDGQSSCVEGSALAIAQTSADPLGETAALGSLGQAHRLMGDYDLAREYLDAALAIAQQADNPLLEASIHADLGATAASQAVVRYRQYAAAELLGDTDRALDLRNEGQTFDQMALQQFQQSLSRPTLPLNQLRVLLAAIPAYDRTGSTTAAQQSRQQAEALLNQLPDMQEKALAAIDLALLQVPATVDQPRPSNQCAAEEALAPTEALLQQAIQIAEQIGDRRSQSFALGALGRLYECQGRIAEALRQTQQARAAAEYDFDSRYLWEWQAGRILQAQNQADAAIQAYEQSVTTLETIRDDILIASRDVQFDFRDAIEPIYRQLMSLRLKQSPPSTLFPALPEDQPNDLSRVLTTLDSLKLAELQNYFGNDCVLIARNLDLTEPEQLLTRGDRAALLSTVILDDQTAIILTLPDSRQQYEWIPLSRPEITTAVNDYRLGLETAFRRYNLEPAQRLYEQLIRPFEATLATAQVETLVFVQDDILRSVPMAALHDGEKFLIQRYAIAYTPSLQLTDLNPLDRENLRALAAGLTMETPANSEAGFYAALSNVDQEISAIKAELPESVTLTNSDFRLERIEENLTSAEFPILHIATHGEFGTEPEDTFLVTGDVPDNKLTLTNLDRLLRQVESDRPVELLVLTACTTAVGDNRAALGLAGAAAQAGVRSVLASLWFVNDQATADLVETFYANLKIPQSSKAEALQQAQTRLIETGEEFSHPAYWAPFVLIGSWL